MRIRDSELEITFNHMLMLSARDWSMPSERSQGKDA
jgi:hypothetical protein